MHLETVSLTSGPPLPLINEGKMRVKGKKTCEGEEWADRKESVETTECHVNTVITLLQLFTKKRLT